MNYFLETIAGSLYDEFGNTLNRHCIVFPNRRAGLFFLKYLASKIERPVWEPTVLTINELFKSHSELQVGGNEVMLFELYRVYRRLRKSAESFDNFFFWGDILLNDFDDIDKYLVNSALLFKNVLDIKNIDQQFGGLTDAQIEIIKKFWLNFNPEKPTDQKKGFRSIWSVLNDIYSEFRAVLRSNNLAYEGMIFRELAENEKEYFSSGDRWDLIHFIGFNALNECEKRVMTRLKKAGKARFYWDYDETYISDSGSNSAGYFMRSNLKVFGNDMPPGWSYKTLISSPGRDIKRCIIDTSSDVAQVKLVSDLLRNIDGLTPENAHQTAIILSDENLLIPMLSSLPENMGDVNITMGYPLRQTLAYTLVKNMMDLQRNSVLSDNLACFSYHDVAGVLKNSMVSSYLYDSCDTIIDELRDANMFTVPETYFSKFGNLDRIFVRPSNPSEISDYFKNILSLVASYGSNNRENESQHKVYDSILNEFVYRIVLTINRLEPIVKSEDVTFTTDTYMRILDRMLRMQSVPFAGEPLSGIQIMGILETRALDFRNLIILSVNEGVLPSVSSPSSSYIPFSLREAFGLPSINHQESIYAYHFFRLLQQSENVVFTYNSNPEGLKSGEMSRFLLQMRYDEILKPQFEEISLEIKSQGNIRDIVERTEEHNARLLSQFSVSADKRLLSPSAINMWLGCRMKFYYRYLNHLKEPEVVKSEIDPAMLGEILHEIMRSLYVDFEGKILSKKYLESLLSDDIRLAMIIQDSVRNKLHYGKGGEEHGNEIIVKDVLLTYLKRILRADNSFDQIHILSLEKKYSFPLDISASGHDYKIDAGGVADRIDILGGVARIVDYKTGSVAETINSISDLFADDRKKDVDGWLQTLLYCEALYGRVSADAVRPSIYKIKKNPSDFNSDKLRLKTDKRTDLYVEDYADIRADFISGLRETVSLIFSENEPFRMTSDQSGKCRYCVYSKLCMR